MLCESKFWSHPAVMLTIIYLTYNSKWKLNIICWSRLRLHDGGKISIKYHTILIKISNCHLFVFNYSVYSKFFCIGKVLDGDLRSLHCMSSSGNIHLTQGRISCFCALQREWRERRDEFKKKVSRIVRKSQEMLWRLHITSDGVCLSTTRDLAINSFTL